MPPLISEYEIDEMYLDYESDAESVYTKILEDIPDISQSRSRVNRREER